MRKQASKKNNVKVGNVLSEFMQNEDFAIDIKDCAGKYTENNRTAAAVSGLEPRDRIGMDIYDIGRINRMPSETIEKIVHADRSVRLDKQPVTLVHTFLDKTTNLIVVDKVFKQAVVNHQDQMIGIFSYAYDIVPYINRFYLYALYKNYYSIKEAIQKFLHHMNITAFFIKMPNELELSLLLHDHYHIEQLSQTLHLSLDDILSYQASIKDKLAMIDYDELVGRLCIPARMLSSHGDLSEILS
jgi:hypothetical protein